MEQIYGKNACLYCDKMDGDMTNPTCIHYKVCAECIKLVDDDEMSYKSDIEADGMVGCIYCAMLGDTYILDEIYTEGGNYCEQLEITEKPFFLGKRDAVIHTIPFTKCYPMENITECNGDGAVWRNLQCVRNLYEMAFYAEKYKIEHELGQDDASEQDNDDSEQDNDAFLFNSIAMGTVYLIK